MPDVLPDFDDHVIDLDKLRERLGADFGAMSIKEVLRTVWRRYEIAHVLAPNNAVITARLARLRVAMWLLLREE